MVNARHIVIAGAALALGLVARPAQAQNVTEVQISPPQIQMKLGDRTQVFATAYATGGNVALGVSFRWQSTDTNVVRVVTDEQSPEVGTLVAVGAGAAVVRAIAGAGAGVPGFTTVTVTAPVQAPIAVTAPIVTDSVLPASVASASLRTVVRIEAQRFGSPAACASGAVVGSGLLVTSYQAIRGVDRVTVALDNGTSIPDPQVMAYSVSNDIAVLRVPAQTPDSLSIATNVTDDQYAWAVSYPACQAVASTSRVRVNSGGGILRLSGVLPESGTGAAVINNTGGLVGVVNGDRTIAALYSRVQSALTDARGNGRPAQAADVGRSENHLYGSFVARSDASGATVRVTPLESWQWSTLTKEGVVPLTFTGPLGRYQVDLLISGAVRASTTVRVSPGITQQVPLAPPSAVAQQPQQAQPTPTAPTPAPAQPPVAKKGGGGAVVPVVLLLGAGGGTAAYFLTKKKTPPCTGPSCTGGGGTTGSVSITVPNP